MCVTCAQDFTRKYSAYRHNRYFHQGRSNIVGTLEYVVGRVAGVYPSADPKAFRKDRTRSAHGNIDNSSSVSVAHDLSYSQSSQNLRGVEYGMSQTPSNEPVGSPPPRQFVDQTTSKIEEIKLLLKNVFPGVDQGFLLNRIRFEIIQGGGSINLDNYLQLLQGIQAMNSRTSSKRPEKPSLSLHPNHYDLPQEAKNMLAEFEQVMSPHIHPAINYDVIEKLADKYRIVGNPNIIRFPLESYRSTGRLL